MTAIIAGSLSICTAQLTQKLYAGYKMVLNLEKSPLVAVRTPQEGPVLIYNVWMRNEHPSANKQATCR